ncbi:MAG TPA: DUF4097 family beta strand repeat-containing protein [Rhodothermales bacterium]|nr:DUF4097 family beta strand repeat-containing protein [Rhodothermales bacterium]
MRTRLLTLTLSLIVLVPVGRAQQVTTDHEWCRREQNSYNNGRRYERHCEVRTYDLGRVSSFTVDAGSNGGIKVIAWDRPTAELHARVTAQARTEEEARRLADGVEIRTGGTIRADIPDDREDNEWASVSYELRVPRSSDLDLEANNGGIAIEGVTGRIRFETSNGGVALTDVGGDVEGRTSNGGLNVALSGERWEGEGLNVRTSNGGVRLSVPEGFGADLEVGTTNGQIDLGFPVTVEGRIGRRVQTTLGRGGPPVRVITTNGGVILRRR